jgi:hypothetical protein
MTSRLHSPRVAFLIFLFLCLACRPRRECPVGQLSCRAGCIDPTITPTDCGSCGNTCTIDQVCRAGACHCPANLTLCGGVCTDLRSSFSNCGACAQACAAGTACFGGQCETTCPPDAGVTNCSGSCVDQALDPRNCGGCSHVCGNTELCQQGVCVGPDLYAVCFSGSLVGYHSRTGEGLTPFTVSVPVADGGAPVVPFALGLIFSDAKTLWLLDTINSLVDVLDVSQWPPAVLGVTHVGQSPNQLLVCNGLMLVVNSVDGTLQGIDLTTRQTVNEVSLGPGTNPFLAACDGEHTAYVTDYSSGDVKAVDLNSWTVTATLAIPPQDFAPGARPYPQGVAYGHPAGQDAGRVFVSLGNAVIDGGIFAPQGDALVLEIDAALQAVQAVLDPGRNCTNGAYLAASADGTQLLESCGGVFGAETSGFVAWMSAPQGQTGLIPVPVANPSTVAVLKNGLAAVDGSGNQLAVFNPFDGGLVQVFSPCPTLPDGGTVSLNDFVGGLAARP